MTTCIRMLFIGSVLAFAQTKPAFEVASIRPAAPLDMAKIMAAVQVGESPKMGPHVDAERAEYTYMALRDLIALAYGVKPYQVSGPEWLANQRFDIAAKLPAGASKDDAPAMLQALLADRFRLVIHRSSAEHPVLALTVGKGALKLKASVGTPVPLDENAPTNPGDIKMNTPDGPIRMSPGERRQRDGQYGASGNHEVQDSSGYPIDAHGWRHGFDDGICQHADSDFCAGLDRGYDRSEATDRWTVRGYAWRGLSDRPASGEASDISAGCRLPNRSSRLA